MQPPWVFDTSSFIIIGHYFPEQFPTFWSKFNDAVAAGEVISVREVRKELETRATRPWLAEWVDDHGEIFRVPSAAETAFVAEIFRVPHFQMLVGAKARLTGKAAADPFVIAAAKVLAGTVVTDEKLKPNAARIPNVCQHFKIECTTPQGFLDAMGWRF